MRGVCVDGLNPTGRPSAIQLTNLNPRTPGARMVMFDDVRFYGYYEQLWNEAIEIAVLLGDESIATGSDYDAMAERYGEVLAPKPPALAIIGNEMNNYGPSSQPKTKDEYLDMWNTAVPALKEKMPALPCCVGGLLGSPDWLIDVFADLDPKPDFLDVHYPNDENVLRAYQQFGVPLAVMEWSYVGGTAQQVTDWQSTLARYTEHSCWFCWSDGMTADNMGLVHPQGRPKAALRNYRKALAALAS